MKDSFGTKQELIEENALLKQRINELEQSEAELKRLNNELRESEEKYRILLSESSDPMFSFTPEGQYRYVNKAFAEGVGKPVEDIIGRSVWDVFPKDEADKRFASLSQVFHTGNQKIIEARVPHTDGDRYYITTITPIKDANGKVLSAVCSSKDITERHRADYALRESEERFRAFMENMPSMVIIKDKELRPLFFNRKFSEMFPAKDWLGKMPEETFTPEIANSMRANDLKALREGFVTYEEEWYDKDDCLRVLETRKFAIAQEDKEPLLGVIITDNTERKRAEEELIVNKNRLSRAEIISCSGNWEFDLESKRVFASEGARKIYGLQNAEWTIPEVQKIPLPEYREMLDRALQGLVKENRRYDVEFKIRRPDSGEIADIHSVAEFDSKRNVVFGVIQDITDRKNMEERLQRAEKMEALGVLAGGVAHDMNNILGVLVGYSELLLREVPEGSRAGKYANNILQGGERAAAIIQDLLTMARRGVSISEAVNLNQIVADCFKTPEFELVKSRHPDVLFRSQVAKDLLNIKGSPVHLSKTIMNLLLNAAESIRGTGMVTITTENRYVDVTIPGYENTQEGDYVVMTVTDTGKGISPADMGRIFEPFYTKKIMGRSGTGLGLAVVWGTIKDHGGYIDVRSEENEGSAFTLYFPVSREASSKQDMDFSPDSYQGRGENILIVDDVEAQRSLAATILENLNYRVATAMSGEAAVEYLRTNNADLIVLDMIMDPGIDGLETYRRILEIQPMQKAIIVSGFAKTDRVSKAQELGAGEYVKKPYVIGKLGIAVRKELDRKWSTSG